MHDRLRTSPTLDGNTTASANRFREMTKQTRPSTLPGMADEGEWDFYNCRVDDAPASIFVNFAYGGRRPAGLDTLYYVGLEILQPGDHGLGVEPDVKELWELEDAITGAAEAAGFSYVGRLRSRGDWQLTFYAKKNKQSELERIVVGALKGSRRGYRIGEKNDAEWEYYEEFLLPDAERSQWIMDRRVVHQLAQAGDVHSVERPVDHFIGFSDPAQRDAFMESARALGFDADAGPADESGEARYPVQLTRPDATELDHIHDVVMNLIELAREHDGDYDGWGAPIAKPE
jgi:regulator of RNase E activity RraB